MDRLCTKGPKIGPITIVSGRFGSVFDHGLADLLAGEKDLQVLRCGLDLSELESAVARESPRVAILGADALVSSSVFRRLRAFLPSIGMVALLHGLSEHYGTQLLAFGATACIAQEASWSDISTSVRLAAEGKGLLVSADPGRQSGGGGTMALTEREWEVHQLVEEGRTNREIASALHIGVETVRTHIQKSNRKLGTTRRRHVLRPDRIERCA
jgi:DNA-binding NarL/FixJ family response regulator